MSIIEYTIEFRSDAEPGSGLGGEYVNDYVTRDSNRRPIVRASHIKGVLRATLSESLGCLGREAVINSILGSQGYNNTVAPTNLDLITSGTCHFSDAVLDEESVPADTDPVHLVSRTAIDSTTGTALSTSLRTTEAIRCETRFNGRVHCQSPGEFEDIIRLGLLSIRSLGGSRNRGSGQCMITISSESRSPGAILKSLQQSSSVAPSQAKAPVASVNVAKLNTTEWMDVVFHAESPVLCPERPEVANVLETGLAIPASALQGALLTALNDIDPDAASACFAHPSFRAWPLLPCAAPGVATGALPRPIRVSLTHRVAKVLSVPVGEEAFTEDDCYEEAFDWTKRPTGSPLKAQDGVLLASAGGVKLWRSADMPRVFTTHGVHDQERTLFSAVSMAPLTWRGLLAVPGEYADALSRAVAEKVHFSFGKARTVRGLGRLTLERVAPDVIFNSTTQRTILIAQTPIALSGNPASSEVTLQSEIKKLADQWSAAHNLGPVNEVWAAGGIQFGWNRHGKAGAARHGRLPATRIAQPGAVIRLESAVKPDRLSRALLAGFGGLRERGFGALLPHPGKASQIFHLQSAMPRRNTPAGEARAIRAAFDHYQKTGRGVLTASQISSVLDRLANSASVAIDFVRGQTQRGALWAKWENSCKVILGWVQEFDPSDARKALEVLRDLVTADGRESQ